MAAKVRLEEGDVVFIKPTGYAMWPAKVTEVAEGRFFKRTVALFGSGRISHITSDSQIFLFTKENIQKFKEENESLQEAGSYRKALEEISKYEPQRPKYMPEESLADVTVNDSSDRRLMEKSVSDPGALLDPLSVNQDCDENLNSNHGSVSVDSCYQGSKGTSEDFSEEISFEDEVGEEAEGRKRERSNTANDDELDRSHAKKPKLIRVRSDLTSDSKETRAFKSPANFQASPQLQRGRARGRGRGHGTGRSASVRSPHSLIQSANQRLPGSHNWPAMIPDRTASIGGTFVPRPGGPARGRTPSAVLQKRRSAPLPRPAAVFSPLPRPAAVFSPLPRPAAVSSPLPRPAAVSSPLPRPGLYSPQQSARMATATATNHMFPPRITKNLPIIPATISLSKATTSNEKKKDDGSINLTRLGDFFREFDDSKRNSSEKISVTYSLTASQIEALRSVLNITGVQ